MSHFTVLVVGDDIETQLAPFDENLEVPRYIDKTRAQLIEEGRAEINAYRDGAYAKYLADPAGYAATITNPGHLAYLRDRFPPKLAWTDDEVYADAIKWSDASDVDDDGALWSTSNPRGKWDWYQAGGRWENGLSIKSDDEWFGTDTTGFRTTIGKLAGSTHPTYALVINGEWFSKGEMGMFGIDRDRTHTDTQWWAEWWKRLSELPADTVVTLVDCHV